MEMVQQQRRQHKKMGGKKLYSLLSSDLLANDMTLGRDKFFDVLGRNGLLVKRRRKYAVTTNSYHGFRVYKNEIIDWRPKRPNELWVSDITYLRTRSGFVYLSLLTDGYSRKIVGWNLSHSLSIEGAKRALSMAMRQKKDSRQLIHHSDRGVQYCCKQYVNILKGRKVKISMAAAGNCYENAMAERVNGILKGEYGLDETFNNQNDTLLAVRQAITAYNEKRPHWSLGLRIPAHVHAA